MKRFIQSLYGQIQTIHSMFSSMLFLCMCKWLNRFISALDDTYKCSWSGKENGLSVDTCKQCREESAPHSYWGWIQHTGIEHLFMTNFPLNVFFLLRWSLFFLPIRSLLVKISGKGSPLSYTRAMALLGLAWPLSNLLAPSSGLEGNYTSLCCWLPSPSQEVSDCCLCQIRSRQCSALHAQR